MVFNGCVYDGYSTDKLKQIIMFDNGPYKIGIHTMHKDIDTAKIISVGIREKKSKEFLRNFNTINKKNKNKKWKR